MPEAIYRPEIDTLFIRLAGFGRLHVARELDTGVYALIDVETEEIVGLQVDNWKGHTVTSFEEWEARQMEAPKFRAEAERQEPSYRRIRRKRLRRLPSRTPAQQLEAAQPLQA